MATIDYSTPVGKLRTRVGDWTDIPYLPDEVYEGVISENNGNLQQASIQCAQYILAQMAYSGRRKMNGLEVYGKEVYDAYKDFLMTIIKNPAFLGFAPVPYSGSEVETNALITFIKDWNANYAGGTQSELLNMQANYNGGNL